MNTVVTVSNLPFSAKTHHIKELFSVVGPVLKVEFQIDQDTHRPKGVAMLHFNCPDDAKRALSFNGTSFNGREMKVFF